MNTARLCPGTSTLTGDLRADTRERVCELPLTARK